MASRANALGDYLRARRERIRPEDVGLGASTRRRVPGLRREELAMLAGISSDYYLRLEQGRDRHPSSQVLDALARAMQLDLKATEYLHQLAGSTGRDRQPQPPPETVAHDLDRLIDQFPMPTIVANRYQDVLAANPIARVLSPGFAPGENFLRFRLLAPAARDFYVDWEEATEVAASGLREVAGNDLDDLRMRALIDELSASSERFRELWARADVGYRTGIVHMRHAKVGDLYLYRNRLNVPYSGGQHVLMYHAEPGSESAKALEALRPQGSPPRTDTAGSPADTAAPDDRPHACLELAEHACRRRQPHSSSRSSDAPLPHATCLIAAFTAQVGRIAADRTAA